MDELINKELLYDLYVIKQLFNRTTSSEAS